MLPTCKIVMWVLVIETIHDLFPWPRHLFAGEGLRR
jgi:hypothetical protein